MFADAQRPPSLLNQRMNVQNRVRVRIVPEMVESSILENQRRAQLNQRAVAWLFGLPVGEFSKSLMFVVPPIRIVTSCERFDSVPGRVTRQKQIGLKLAISDGSDHSIWDRRVISSGVARSRPGQLFAVSANKPKNRERVV